MTTKQIADRLVEICRTGNYEMAHKELFAENAVSIEPEASPAFEKETKGLAAIAEKTARWNAMVEEVHHLSVSEPMVANNSFACTMTMGVSIRQQGRMDMTELCVYKTKDNKIISEEFFM